MTTTAVTQYLLVSPDWKQSFSFKKKWNTGFQTSINNTEKRSELFTWPRRTLIFTLKTKSTAHASYLRRILHKNTPYVWGVPIWQDGASLTAQAASGQKVLACDTTNRNYEVGGQAILFTDKDNYEVGTIDSLTDSTITLVDNLTITWAEGTQVYPILKGHISKTQKITWRTNEKPTLEIQVVETYDEVTRQTPSISTFPTYQDIPIFNTPPNWVQPIEESQIFDYELLEYLGASQLWSEWENGEFRFKAKHSAHTKAKIKEITDFFDYNKGRWGVFWRPSYLNDIKVTSAASAGAITIDIEDIEYNSYWDGDRNGLHVMLIWPDNNYQVNSIKSSSGTTMTFNAGLAYDITADDLGPIMICYLNLVRFNHDEIESNYINDSMASFSLVFQTASQEIPAGITTTTTTSTTTTSTTSTTQSTSSTTSTTQTTSTSSSTTSTTRSVTTTTGAAVSTTTTSSTTTTTAVGIPWLGSYAQRRKITVDNTNIDADLTQFPLPVYLSEFAGRSLSTIASVDDDFTGTDGDPPNSTFWKTGYSDNDTDWDHSGVISIQSNELDMSIPTAKVTAPFVSSKYFLTGDFDIQVDFGLDATPSPDTGWSFGLFITGLQGDPFGQATYAYMDREIASRGPYRASTYNGGASQGGSADLSGKLRMARTGSSLVMYYWNGSSWTTLRTDASYGTSNAYVCLFARMNTSGDNMDCNFDNFVLNSGSFIFDVNAGDRTDVTDIFDALVYPKQQATVDDTFTGTDGDAPNSILWDRDELMGTLQIYSNKLRSVATSTTGVNRIVSKFLLQGDFDIQIDFDLVSVANSNNWNQRLQVLATDGSVLDIARRYGSGDYYFDTYRNQYGSYSTGATGTVHTSGKLRLVRVGSTCATYYWNGASWTAMSTGISWTTEDIYVNVYSQIDTTSQSQTVDFDNFTVNAGTIAWPTYDDHFTGTDTDPPNTDIWDISASVGTTEIQSNYLSMVCNSNNCYSEMIAKVQAGDFDIKVQFSSFLRTSGDVYARLIFEAFDDTYKMMMIRYHTSGGNGFYTHRELAGSATAQGATANTATSGALRITRVGNTVTCYYRTTAGWVSNHSYQDDGFNGDSTITLRLGSGVGTVDWNNFEVDAQSLVWPRLTFPHRKKIAFTKSDATTQIMGEIESWDQTNEKALFFVSDLDLVLATAAETELYIYFDPEQSDNDNFIGDTQDELVSTAITGDDFDGTDGDDPDKELWNLQASAGSAQEIDTNKLVQTITSAIATAAIHSKFALQGDFDIQYDFDVTTETTTNIWLNGFTVQDNEGTFIASIDLRYSTGKYYQSYIAALNNNASTTDSSGKLRITRVGSLITTYYWNGSSWTSLHSTSTGTNTNDARVVLRTSVVTSAQTIVASLDNFLINSADAVIVNPARFIWDNDYTAVFHFAQDPNGDVANSILDSTRFKKNATPYGTMLTEDLVNGEIGKAIALDGTDDYIDIPSPGLIPETDPWTLFSMLKSFSAGALTVSGAGLTADTWSLRQHQNTGYAVAGGTLVTCNFTDPTYLGNVWNTFTFTRTGTTFESGTNDGTKASDTQSGSMRGVTSGYVAKTIMGAYWNSGAAQQFEALQLSETRFSKILRSDEWLKAEHYSMKDALITFASTEDI